MKVIAEGVGKTTTFKEGSKEHKEWEVKKEKQDKRQIWIFLGWGIFIVGLFFLLPK